MIYAKHFLLPGNLRNITKLKPWDLYSVFVDKYNWNSLMAREITDFLEPMLCYDANLRASAAQWLVVKTISERFVNFTHFI